jgi:hypothetical protein
MPSSRNIWSLSSSFFMHPHGVVLATGTTLFYS